MRHNLLYILLKGVVYLLINCTTNVSNPQVWRFSNAKKANLILASVLEELGDRRFESVRNCAMEADYRWCTNCDKSHVSGTWCCHHRLCPLCQVRRSRKLAANALEAFELMRSSGDLDHSSIHLLTLTQKNVELGQLVAKVDDLLDALKRLRNVRDARNYIVGAARNIEVTYNFQRHTWHPHVHFIMIIRDGKPEMTTGGYWRVLWRDLMRLDYDPIVDIRPIIDDGAIFEVSKYVAKSIELLHQLPDSDLVPVVGELNTALKDRALVAYMGSWRLARRELKMKNDDFVDFEEESKTDKCKCGGQIFHAVMVWNGNEYVFRDVVEDG